MKYYKVSPDSGGFTPMEQGFFEKSVPRAGGREDHSPTGGHEQEVWDEMMLVEVLRQIEKRPLSPENAMQMLAAFERDFKDAYAAAKVDPKDKAAADRLDTLLAFYNRYLAGTVETKVRPSKKGAKPTSRFEATA